MVWQLPEGVGSAGWRAAKVENLENCNSRINNTIKTKIPKADSSNATNL